MRRLLVLLLGLSLTGLFFAPPLFAGELDLTVPSAPAATKKAVGNAAPCKGCGVVTNVRQLAPAADQAPPPPDSPYLITFAEASREPEGGVDASGTRINTWEEWPKGVWQTTVRYDDGSYATHQSEKQPPFQKGDHVQLISGKLVPR